MDCDPRTNGVDRLDARSLFDRSLDAGLAARIHRLFALGLLIGPVKLERRSHLRLRASPEICDAALQRRLLVARPRARHAAEDEPPDGSYHENAHDSDEANERMHDRPPRWFTKERSSHDLSSGSLLAGSVQTWCKVF